MSEKFLPPNDWHIIEPGLIELVATKIRIRHDVKTPNAFIVEWDGTKNSDCGTLQRAKDRAFDVLNEMLLMGYEG